MTIRDQKRAGRSTAGLDNIRAKLMLVLLCLLWGINWPVMKIALQEIPPLSMRTISSAFAAFTLLGICAVSRRRLGIASAKSSGHVCVISLLNIGFFSILSAYAQITAATTRVLHGCLFGRGEPTSNFKFSFRRRSSSRGSRQ